MSRERLLRAGETYFALAMNDGYGAHCGPSRGDPCGSAIRPKRSVFVHRRLSFDPTAADSLERSARESLRRGVVGLNPSAPLT